MLQSAVKAAGLENELDAVLSVDAIRMFKPRMEVYQLATNSLKVAAADAVFVSSNRWDVMGASAFGFRPAWINRARMPDEYPELAPFKVLSSLSDLLSLT
jgi:2-haloacid dehalogenase